VQGLCRNERGGATKEKREVEIEGGVSFSGGAFREGDFEGGSGKGLGTSNQGWVIIYKKEKAAHFQGTRGETGKKKRMLANSSRRRAQKKEVVRERRRGKTASKKGGFLLRLHPGRKTERTVLKK